MSPSGWRHNCPLSPASHGGAARAAAGVQKIHSFPKSSQPSPCEQAAPARGGGCCRTQQPGDRFFSRKPENRRTRAKSQQGPHQLALSPPWPSGLLAALPHEAQPPGPLSSWILAQEGLHLPPPQGTFPLDCVPWVSPWNTKVWMPPTCPQGVIFSSAPGGQLFSRSQDRPYL